MACAQFMCKYAWQCIGAVDVPLCATFCNTPAFQRIYLWGPSNSASTVADRSNTRQWKAHTKHHIPPVTNYMHFRFWKLILFAFENTIPNIRSNAPKWTGAPALANCFGNQRTGEQIQVERRPGTGKKNRIYTPQKKTKE